MPAISLLHSYANEDESTKQLLPCFCSLHFSKITGSTSTEKYMVWSNSKTHQQRKPLFLDKPYYLPIIEKWQENFAIFENLIVKKWLSLSKSLPASDLRAAIFFSFMKRLVFGTQDFYMQEKFLANLLFPLFNVIPILYWCVLRATKLVGNVQFYGFFRIPAEPDVF